MFPPRPLCGRPQHGVAVGWGDINIHIDINMNIDIHIIINMNIEYYIIYVIFSIGIIIIDGIPVRWHLICVGAPKPHSRLDRLAVGLFAFFVYKARRVAKNH